MSTIQKLENELIVGKDTKEVLPTKWDALKCYSKESDAAKTVKMRPNSLKQCPPSKSLKRRELKIAKAKTTQAILLTNQMDQDSDCATKTIDDAIRFLSKFGHDYAQAPN